MSNKRITKKRLKKWIRGLEDFEAGVRRFIKHVNTWPASFGAARNALGKRAGKETSP
jgi:hypothetical protein